MRIIYYDARSSSVCNQLYNNKKGLTQGFLLPQYIVLSCFHVSCSSERQRIGGQGLSSSFIHLLFKSRVSRERKLSARIVMCSGSSRCSSIMFTILLSPVLPTSPPADATLPLPGRSPSLHYSIDWPHSSRDPLL